MYKLQLDEDILVVCKHLHQCQFCFSVQPVKIGTRLSCQGAAGCSEVERDGQGDHPKADERLGERGGTQQQHPVLHLTSQPAFSHGRTGHGGNGGRVHYLLPRR